MAGVWIGVAAALVGSFTQDVPFAVMSLAYALKSYEVAGLKQ